MTDALEPEARDGRRAKPRKRRGAGEGSIRRREDGRWEGRLDVGWRGGRRLQRSVYGETRQQVRDELRRLRDGRDGGLDIAHRPPRLSEYLEHWLAIWQDRVRPSTWSFYATIVRRHILPSLGQVRLDELSPQQIERLLYERARSGLSSRTVKASLDVLRISLNHAVRTGVLGRNVGANVLPPRVVHKPISFLTAEEAKRLISAAREGPIGPLVTLCITTGLRQGEALALQWKDVDLELGTVAITKTIQRRSGRGLEVSDPKTARSRRRVVLPAIALSALREHAKRESRSLGQPGNADFVFRTTDSTPLDASNVRRDFERLLKHAGVPRIRFHDLRHSAASLLLTQGVHPRVVMEQLGHSQISVTLNTYSHVIPPLMREAASAMDRALDSTANGLER